MYDTVAAKLVAAGATSFNVTHYVLSLGNADTDTGHYAKNFDAGSTITMIIVGKAQQQILSGTGQLVRLDALGFTQTAVSVGDKIKLTISAVDYYYIVESALPHPAGNLIVTYTVNLVYWENPV